MMKKAECLSLRGGTRDDLIARLFRERDAYIAQVGTTTVELTAVKEIIKALGKRAEAKVSTAGRKATRVPARRPVHSKTTLEMITASREGLLGNSTASSE
jgi:hypothetical protein